MAPPRKVPPGSVTRSVLLRADQVAALDAAAALLGADLSDVVRGLIDLLVPPVVPPDSADVWARVRAALELRRRRLVDRPEPGAPAPASDTRRSDKSGRELKDKPGLVRAILDGWRGKEPRLPLLAAGREAARLVGEAIGMLQMLFPKVTKGAGGADRAEEQWKALAGDWAGMAPPGLLTLLACPAARCLSYPKWAAGEQPWDVILAREVVTHREKALMEQQYVAVGEAVADLVKTGAIYRVGDAEEKWPFHLLPVVHYWIDWKKIEKNRR